MHSNEQSEGLIKQQSRRDSATKRPVSERRIQANRRNALRSTGPKTPRGKSIVSRNALKHGLLAREVVITAGDGEENLEEFHGLVDRLVEYYETFSVHEEMLVQKIATCWWRLARATRAENGEIRRRLDSAIVTCVLRASDRFGRDRHENRTIVEHLTGVLWNARCEIASDGQVSERIKNLLVEAYGVFDNVVTACTLVANEKTAGKESSPQEAGDRVSCFNSDFALGSIDRRLEELELLRQQALEREKLKPEAAARSLSLPSEDATDKLLRYEAHLDRQLYRAMDQLERLQRQRKGEKMPPPLNINLGHGN